jgi:hypothetical protein
VDDDPPGLATSQNWGKRKKKSPGSQVAYKTPIITPRGKSIYIYIQLYILPGIKIIIKSRYVI